MLILGQRLPLRHLRGVAHPEPRQYDVHNAKALRQNARHRRNGRPDLQADSRALTIEIRAVEPVDLAKLHLRQARAAGYLTVQELQDDWRSRHRGQLGPAFAHTFAIVEERFLHRDPARGYTHDPTEGVEPAVDEETQRRLTELGTLRWKQEHARREAAADMIRLHNRLHELERAYARGEAHLEADLRVIRQRIQAIKRRRESEAA